MYDKNFGGGMPLTEAEKYTKTTLPTALNC